MKGAESMTGAEADDVGRLARALTDRNWSPVSMFPIPFPIPQPSQETPHHVLATLSSTDEPLRELALFAGGGGGILAAQLLGHRVVCAVELDGYARACLVARQNDGSLPAFPIWDDVSTFDGRPWRGRVDAVSGGFPCQDISPAGRGEGIEGERSGLWRQMARVIREVRPRVVIVENSSALIGRGLGTVLGDLAAMGYHARWGVVGAADAIWSSGNPIADHERHRIWIIAVRVGPDRSGEVGVSGTAGGETSNTYRSRFNGGTDKPGRGPKRRTPAGGGGKAPVPAPADTDLLFS